MKKSTHRVDVVPVRLEPHPNADSLSIVRVGAYTVCARTSDWQNIELAAYVPPDSLVNPSLPPFSFLANKAGADGYARVTAIKLRGIVSYGLLVPAPEGAKEGDDVSEALGVKRYEPVVAETEGDPESPPPIPIPHYDLDALQRYVDVFKPGELVVCTEKVDGANARYVFTNGRMYCGSRTEWKREGEGSLWWRALKKTPTIEEFCRANPDTVLYGECYGWVQKLRYGHARNEVSFASFDVFRDGQYLSPGKAMQLTAPYGVPWVPDVCTLAFNIDQLLELAEGLSLVPGADHVREGIVVSPLTERWDERVGRVKLKLVGAGYLQNVK